MMLWGIFFTTVLMTNFGSSRLVSLLMECLCMTPLMPTMMVMRGLVFQPSSSMPIKGSYINIEIHGHYV